MSLYTGSNCPICAKEFEKTDDIVVCPVCGSPHHRACYKALGHCGNEDYHAEGRQWEGPAMPEAEAEEPQNGDTVRCPSCGAANPAQGCFCNACGHRMNGEGGSVAQQSIGGFAGFAQQQCMDFDQVLDNGVTVKEACDYVGPNALPFAVRFRRVAHGAPSFNWCAFFFTFYYCFYRKMYKLGAILLAVYLLILIPSGYAYSVAFVEMINAGVPLTFPFEFVMDGTGYKILALLAPIVQLITMVSRVAGGFLFNKMYYKQMLTKVETLRKSGRHVTGSPEHGYAVSSAGGVNFASVLMVVAIIFAVSLVMSYLTIMLQVG